jgi:hypothetical protein
MVHAGYVEVRSLANDGARAAPETLLAFKPFSFGHRFVALHSVFIA